METYFIGTGTTEDLSSNLRVYRDGQYVFMEIISDSRIGFWERVGLALKFVFLRCNYVLSLFELSPDTLKRLRDTTSKLVRGREGE